MTITYDKLFYGGEWISPIESRGAISVTSASTEAILGYVPETSPSDLDAAVEAARRAFDDPTGWSTWEPKDRADAMRRLAVELDARSVEMARRVSMQNGMPISIAEQLEGNFPQVCIRYYADLAENMSVEDTRPHLLEGLTTSRREPLGVVAAIVPFNFPQTLSAMKHAPALAAGCTVVLKPSPETVLDAFLFAEAVEAAGLPPGVVNIVTGGREIGEALISHQGISRVAFTGSTAAGRRIAEVCGRLLRPVSLELGGKSAAILLDDLELDLETMAVDLYQATLLNAGQTCYLGTRILAPRKRYDEMVDFFATFLKSLPVGDSLDPATLIGPMVSEQHRERVEGFITTGRSEGRVVVGGGRPASQAKGWFVEPTLFADVDNSSTIATEEIFGPVLAMIPYDSEDEAVSIANASQYGLGGSVWTADPARGRAVANRMATGTVGINRFLPDPGSPFGGRGASGLGHELGPEALGTYQSYKSIFWRR